MNQLRQLLDSAKNQLGYSTSYNQDGSVRHVTDKAAASVSTFSMRELDMPAFLSGEGLHKVHCPMGAAAGKRSSFSDAVLGGSRVLRAGAKPILVRMAQDAIPVAGEVLAFQKQDTSFAVIEAAKFAFVLDGTQLAASPLPVYREFLETDLIKTYGFRVELTRAEQRQYAEGQLADTVLASMAMGVSRLVDAVLLSAIVSSAPATFTLGGAAAVGVEFGELRALVGTAGTGATIGQDGTLRAAGVPAELTPDTAPSIVGAFNRSAVAIMDDMTLVAERIGRDGDQAITCWINLDAMLPLPGAFFVAA